jgi:hypothetical protein
VVLVERRPGQEEKLSKGFSEAIEKEVETVITEKEERGERWVGM